MFTAFNIPVQYVKFGAHVYFELHKDDRNNNKYIVKYFYDGEKKLEKDYYEFKKRISEVIWSDEKIKDFCYRNDNKTDDKGFVMDNFKLALIITNSIFLLTTIVFLALFVYYKKKYNNKNENMSVEPFVS